jgi:hypothetical protein
MMHAKVSAKADALRAEGDYMSPMWCKYALLMWSLDAYTPSNGYGADYMLEFGLIAGVAVETMRKAFEVNVPELADTLAIRRQV